MDSEEEKLKHIEKEKCYDCYGDTFHKIRSQPPSGWVYDGVQCAECGKVDWQGKFFYP